MIYLDNAATTRPCPEAIDAVTRALTEAWGNPSAGHTPGRTAKAALDSARSKILSSLRVREGTLIFTSGGTEADNQAIKSAAFRQRHKGKHIISSQAEHEAVLNSLNSLKEQGWEVTLLAPDRFGRVPVCDVEAALRPDTALVSLMLVNNETGAVNDIPAIRRLLKEHNSPALLHTDAVQAYLKIPFSAKTLGADMISLSSHKIRGPKGAGALWLRDGLTLPPFLHGGGQEGNLRSGTEATPAIFGFAAAAAAMQDAPTAHYAHLREILRESLPKAVFVSDSEVCAPHICCISLPGCRAEVLQNQLDSQGVCISRGSACAKGRRSHVLEAMQLPAPVIDGALRISFGADNTEDEVREFAALLLAAQARFFRHS